MVFSELGYLVTLIVQALKVCSRIEVNQIFWHHLHDLVFVVGLWKIRRGLEPLINYLT